MHVHELNPKKTLVALALFAVIIVIGLVTLSKPRLSYVLTPQQTIDLVTYDEGFVFPYELEDILNKTIDTVIVVDIRNTFQFGRGHIPGAENISAVELLSKESIKRLKQLQDANQAILIYGNNLTEANGPYMVLRQIGFSNVKVLMGGYDYYKEWQDMLADSYGDDSYFMGAADFDYAEVAENTNISAENDNDSKPAVTFQRKKKAKVAEGGC